MINSQKCPHCKGVKKSHIGNRLKICGYCMQPVKEKSDKVAENSNEEIIGMESVSFLTTSGVTALGILGFELSIFNALFLGLLSAFLITDLFKPIILTLKAIGVVLILLFATGKIVDFTLYFIEQIIIFFELKNSLELKDSVVSIFELCDHFLLV
ncbi:hypothetical protein [Gramella sp. KN1008]|uniref:hypothetical protein n=1 Tax=Gramella sp. KN1008 TaxID=2529298 RepID=UPI00103D66B3|nr:hypothetical protein [Gramella sp. KN1008]TBW26410.1 hypothetical protein EZJ28_14500 [Gramella sp. KN1008]